MKPSKWLILPAVFFTAFSSIFIRWISAPPLAIAFYRMLFTVILLFPYVFSKHRNAFLQLNPSQKKLSWLSGGFLAIHFATWIASLSYTSVAASTVLVSCSPIAVAFYETTIRRKPLPRRFIQMLLLAIFGTLLIVSDAWNQPSRILGNVLALIGGFAMAGYLIIGSEQQQTIPFWVYVLHVYGASAFILGTLLLFSPAGFVVPSLEDVGLIFAMTLACSLLGHTVYNWLLRYHGAPLVAMATLCEPIFATLLAFILLRESPSTWTLLGGFFVLVSVNLVLLARE